MNHREFIKSIATAGITATELTSINFPNVLMGVSRRGIKVGHIHPLSGFLTLKGDELKRGSILAVEEIKVVWPREYAEASPVFPQPM